MNNRFQTFVRTVIKEITAAKNKRAQSKDRYDAQLYPKTMSPRKIKNKAIKTASQQSKLGYQQYTGDPFGKKGIRVRNKSEKTPQEIAIAKGLSNYVEPKGVNPKKPGSSVNSKQGNMEIKYILANGKAKVGQKNRKFDDILDKKVES